MAQKNDDLLMEDELAAAFLTDDQFFGNEEQAPSVSEKETESKNAPVEKDWEEEDTLPGQLAVDVYESEDKLIIKARTAGVDKKDLDVSISEGMLTISGTLSSGDEVEATNFHIQECYWGEFTRTLALPVVVKEDEVEAVLKDGVLTISFTKVKQEQAKKIEIL